MTGWPWNWDPARPTVSLPGRNESPRDSPGPCQGGVQKVSETVSKESPESQDNLFRDSGDSFETASDTFGPRGRKASGDPLETLWGFWARRAWETPLRGGRGPNPGTEPEPQTRIDEAVFQLGVL